MTFGPGFTLGPATVPSLQVMIANGNETSIWDDCWIPGIIISRSGLEVNWGSSSLLSELLRNRRLDEQQLVACPGDGMTRKREMEFVFQDLV